MGEDNLDTSRDRVANSTATLAQPFAESARLEQAIRANLRLVIMRCALCRHGETRLGPVTVTLQRRETTVIVKGVPADICENCGEHYLSESVTERLLEKAEGAVRSGTEVQILRFAV